jgi:hypothetical protein
VAIAQGVLPAITEVPVRKRFALLTISALMVDAFMMPAVAAAQDGLYYRILRSDCPVGGVGLHVRLFAKGFTGANRLVIKSWVSQKAASGNTWTKIVHYPLAEYSYVPDGTKHFLDVNRSDPGTPNHRERMVFDMKIWNDAQLLWSGRVHSGEC